LAIWVCVEPHLFLTGVHNITSVTAKLTPHAL
jgi:hypothetical protein